MVARLKIKTLDGDVSLHQEGFFSFPGSGTDWSVVYQTADEGGFQVSGGHASADAARAWLEANMKLVSDGGVILIDLDDFRGVDGLYQA